MQYVGSHYLPEVLLRHPVTLFLCAVHEDDVIGVQGHLVEEVEEALECVAVGPREEKAEQTKRVSTLATRLDTWGEGEWSLLLNSLNTTHTYVVTAKG